MAQWTVAMDARVRQPDGTCVVRVRTRRSDAQGNPLYVTVTLRDGDTLRTDDATMAAILDALTVTLPVAGKVLAPLAVRPSSPTHDLDTKQADPLPTNKASRAIL
jgi:hypothetical protein